MIRRVAIAYDLTGNESGISNCDSAVAYALPTPTPTVTPTKSVHTEGEGVIVTLKPGHPSSLPADGKSQTVLLVDIDASASCWGGPDILSGKLNILTETSLGTVSNPGSKSLRATAGKLLK